MRQITKLAIAAFQTATPFNQANTTVLVVGQTVELRLHGNLIALRDSAGALHVSSAGWETNTTKERLNGLPGVSVNQSKGQWYLNGRKWEQPHVMTAVQPATANA